MFYYHDNIFPGSPTPERHITVIHSPNILKPIGGIRLTLVAKTLSSNRTILPRRNYHQDCYFNVFFGILLQHRKICTDLFNI